MVKKLKKQPRLAFANRKFKFLGGLTINEYNKRMFERTEAVIPVYQTDERDVPMPEITKSVNFQAMRETENYAQNIDRSDETEGYIARQTVNRFEKYCVIGFKARSFHTGNRTWFSDPNKAVSHAKNLLQKNLDGRENNDTRVLFVVKMVKQVNIDTPSFVVREII